MRVIPGGLGAANVRFTPKPGDGLASGEPLPSVASLNLGPTPGDLEANLRMAEAEIHRAKREDPSIKWVVLPELFTSAYSNLENVSRHAEDAERGMSVWRLSTLAHELGIFIAYGFPERLPGGGVATSANLVGPGSGGPLLTYRKINLVATTPEHLVFTPGTEIPVAEAGGVRVALAVCWDVGHPETIREAAKDGAELILAPAAWRDPWGAQYDLACASRALDNAVYLASANQKGAYSEASFGASGGVYGPDGVRASEIRGAASVARLDSALPSWWRTFYGDTLHRASPETFEEACS